MGRRGTNRRAQPNRSLPTPPRLEVGPDGYDYHVRPVAGARAEKTYRCPGCDHEIKPGTAHVLVWPADGADMDDRRHWHSPCWTNRGNRAPTRRWS
ncbi:hypothetical protein ACXPWS_07915 [Mycobacterium sp. BMJ-28]